MNRREAAGKGFDKAGRISNCFKDRDEELSFFRELKKREKDQFGSFGLSRMNSGGRKGAEFLGETGKNDYNWLKTPPATPLFPSLEMDTNAQELVVQREIPIIQPVSRFAGKSYSNIHTSPMPKPKLPQRHIGRPSIDKRNMKGAPLVTPKPNKIKSTFPKNFPNSHSSARSSITGVSNETPPNLRTSSATRGRPAYQNLPAPQKQDPKIMRRQSCSPRGRKLESNAGPGNLESGGGNRVQVVGSRMVDKFMNARMSNDSKIKLNGSMNESSRSCNGEERQPKIKLNASLNETSGFGRLIQRDSSNGRKIGMVPGRKS
ncbi:uncharacterized protein LOC130991191 isoform X2 [Salvia miltiorrhiza]|uniref:uncharacterized protein LOC130991191 isoform X2 n=1 Tax=Salvia miltiorrhiza TaxID=226208 RepID=UPI0025AC2410|nr:uncharacterized protein LOC130991191 isoform X2 [Salvia miltiorrhiza]